MRDDRHIDYTHFFCICCGTPTTSIGMGMDELIINRDERLESAMYKDAIVDSVSAGYGSSHDGDVYYIAICDKCTAKALDDGRLAYKTNYMGMPPLKEHIDRWDKGYKKRMRDINLGDLLK